MRLIVCSGHEKPITRVKFNRDGDLLFSSGKDNIISVWDPKTGERLGTYEGHNGAVADFDVSFNSNYIITAGLDSKLKIFCVRDGRCVYTYDCGSRVRCVEYSPCNKYFFGIKPPFSKYLPKLMLFRNPVYNENYEISPNEPENEVKINIDDELDEKDNIDNSVLECEIEIKNFDKVKNFNISRAIWSPLNKYIFSVCSDGTIRIIDVKNKKKEIQRITFDYSFDKKYGKIKEFTKELTNIKYSNNYCTVIVTSRSSEARMYDITNPTDWKLINVYKTGRSLNTLALHPKLNCICLGGGKTAMQAALDKKAGNYEILLYHTYFKSTARDNRGFLNGSLGIVPSDCFSPLNTMTWSPDGNIFVAGYEEGQVRIYLMDKKFTQQFENTEKSFIKDNDDDDE